ncbi:NADH-quinone oxidoreductase subunit B family protein [Methanococcus aeolicus]|jgi:energy-converting hydrogenase A subunit N|uniref:NADH ubiquinone oxidoreductase 20 kDa subunit n=1 Tax=Methanococcus aeolicus (strain ATCC BAA-1280 / DSM 17508 / OCM 812 / Nankai-3) TaxID=419665 RepID=A6UTY5_META3|nr:NADH-quinone oxidoreductase subunit NuoB [Methanococcus aeolicus]ABR55957.1 NADH ubiquinone oxidoreductase 20 kDa subunit [Methanococcus aeolicus Nankai-3]UXM85445.1 NADH-quinone oxidoreductase subunit B family protein [Methanococcus aeolicus]
MIKEFFRKRSINLCIVNTGGCNGCDIELVSTLAPRYDIEQYGVYVHNNPREADILVITGPVTLPWKDKLVEIYEKTPEPKIVVAVGACALSGGIFKEGHIYGPVDKFIPVDAKIVGCPPRPSEIIEAVLKVAPDALAAKGIALKNANKVANVE